MANMHLRIAAPTDYLFYNQATVKNGTKEYSGLVFDILESLTDAFNFSYEILEAKTYGTARNGLAGMIHRKEVNMSVGAITPTYERYQVADFLTTYQVLDTTFVTYLPPPEPDIFLSIRPFNITMASLLALTWIISSMLICLIFTRGNPISNKWFLMLDIMSEMLGAGLKQSATCLNKSSSSRFRTIFACWNMLSLIVTTLYVSHLVALAAVPPDQETIDSFGELANRQDYKVMIYDGSSVKEAFKTSKRGALADIWKNQIGPEHLLQFTESYISIVKRLSSKKLAFISNVETLRSLRSIDCQLHIANDRAYGSSLAFAASKDAQFLTQFNGHIQALVQSGIISKWVSSYHEKFFNMTRCQEDKRTATLIITANIAGPLITLALGLVCALSVAVIEFSIVRYTQQKNIV